MDILNSDTQIRLKIQAGKPMVYLNGEVYPAEEAKISVFDRGFLFGDSVYEVTRTYYGVPFLLKEHLDRLNHSARGIGMTIPWSHEELTEKILNTLKISNVDQAYIRIIVTRGEGEIGLDPNLSGKSNLVIIVKPLPDYPTWWYQKGVEVVIADVLRNDNRALDANIKSGNYLNNVMAYMSANKNDVYDAIMLNQAGYLTEATTSNLWIYKQGQLLTPPLEAGILKGITRRTLIQLIQENGLSFKEQQLSTHDLLKADEVFLTSSSKGIVPVVKLAGHKIGKGKPGDQYKRLDHIYKQFIQDYNKKFLH